MNAWLILPAACLALIFWACTAMPESWGKSVVKTASVALLAASAAVSGAPGLLVLGLALGAAGDFALSRRGERAFLAGVAAFAAGHLAYLALFIARGAPVWSPTAPGWVLIGLGLGMAALLWPRTGALRWPVMAYLVLIVAMGLAAFALPLPGLAYAAALFIASDSLLAAERFLLPPGALRRALPWLVWPLYWLAQLQFLSVFAGPAGI
ncbi:MAG: lysoplasmalogenase [Limimaricola sp.]|uniref:lysoplasmalogenase n=1 Tax=Limimaricola sp. TaxID=2211665 RepID=UPI001D461AC7|nr:lysoplasmalogenase [Limimaricola sp.]MBI1416160.1 lysoplasmalogenase [Limimaricola sp.]